MTGILLKGKCCGEACCLPDGTCRNLSRERCLALGGTPQGCGTSCEDPDIQCEDVQACCFDDGNCLDFSPAECVALGGTPQGEGTECSSAIACVPCFNSSECNDPWIANGCPFSIAVSVSDVLALDNFNNLECTSSSGGNVVYTGPACLDSCAYTYPDGDQQIGESDCDGGGLFIFLPAGGGSNLLHCVGEGDCSLWVFSIALSCRCEADPFVNIEIIFNWIKRSVTSCAPLGNWGTSEDPGGNNTGSSAVLVLS